MEISLSYSPSRDEFVPKSIVILKLKFLVHTASLLKLPFANLPHGTAFCTTPTNSTQKWGSMESLWEADLRQRFSKTKIHTGFQKVCARARKHTHTEIWTMQ